MRVVDTVHDALRADPSGTVATSRRHRSGAKPITWMAVTAEWAPYWASPEVAATSAAFTGAAGLARDYVFAQLTAGVVQLPDSLSHLAPAGATA